MRLLLITLTLTLLIDQASKWFILDVLHLDERLVLEVVPPFLQFHMAWNTGVNFGLFGGVDMKWVLIGLALVVCAGVLRWVLRSRPNRWVMLFAGLLVGGALGNVIDRLRFGAVVDFLNTSCCGFNNPYAFNIADIAIFVGAIGLVIVSPEPKKRSRKDA